MARIKYTGMNPGRDGGNYGETISSGEPQTALRDNLSGLKAGAHDPDQLDLTQLQQLRVHTPSNSPSKYRVPHQFTRRSLSIPASNEDVKSILSASSIIADNDVASDDMPSWPPSFALGHSTTGFSENQADTQQANQIPSDISSDMAPINQPQSMSVMMDINQVLVGGKPLSGTNLQDLVRISMHQNAVPGPSQPATTCRKIKRAKVAAENSGSGKSEDIPHEGFNILRAIVRHPQLVFYFAKYLRVEELVTVYSISKDFHVMMDTQLTAVVISQAIRRAPHSARIFPFRCYRKLCIEDPIGDFSPVNNDREPRLVPSLRWLRMVCWREFVVTKILKTMANDGLVLPKECEIVIKKLWFLMDIPDNNRRIGTVQNKALWSDIDLLFATMFIIKLDMRFTDPVTGQGRSGLMRMLMAQPSLTLLYHALKRTALVDNHETLQAYIRWKHEPSENYNGVFMFGVSPKDIGKLQYEGYGRIGSETKLLRPDELILKECVRRNMDMQWMYFETFQWYPRKPKSKFKPAVASDRIQEHEEASGHVATSAESAT